MSTIKGLPNLNRVGSLSRPPNPKSFAAMPKGPREFTHRAGTLLGGPGPAPPGLVTATTSGSEWIIYWALDRVLAPNEDPRKPPFFGSKDPSIWVYQYAYSGGRNFLGGAVIDFVVFPYAYGVSKLIRLQTEQYHIFTDNKKQTYDNLQQAEIGKYGEVYDIFEQQILKDKTGQAAIMAVKDCLEGRLEIDPLLTGQATRVRV